MTHRRLLFTVLVLLVILPQSLTPCTTFCFREAGGWIYGRNFDWHTGHCLIMVNKRGVSKIADSPVGHNPAKWVSKYGSVTFNQYGREFPLGGMNEAGLVIECMWLRPAQYPAADARAELSELQWIQYQLDNCATVAEVIDGDETVRIAADGPAPLHFLVCDAEGEAAAVEFLEGKMVVHTGKDLPVTALTNSTYDQSIGLYREVDEKKRIEVLDTANYSLKRFVWAGQGVRRRGARAVGSPVDHAFKILEKVAVRRTVFRIVYDVKNRRIYFRTRENSGIRFFAVDRFDFSCRTPVKILDIAGAGEGDVTGLFSNYSLKANEDLIRRSFSETGFLRSVPESQRRARAQYPDTLPCDR